MNVTDDCSVIILDHRGLDRENMEKITLSIVVKDEHGQINTPQKDTGLFQIIFSFIIP